jgi:hypothetical protein
MIVTAIFKVFREGKTLSGNVNEKRVVISFVSFVVGCGYIFGFLEQQNALCFGLITLLFTVILKTVSEKKREFFNFKNIAMVVL